MGMINLKKLRCFERFVVNMADTVSCVVVFLGRCKNG